MLLLIKPNNKALGSIFMTVCLGGVYHLCTVNRKLPIFMQSARLKT